MGAIDFVNDQDIDACVEEVMMIDEEARFEELPMDEPSLELKTLQSTLKSAFFDEEKAKPVIISSKLDIKKEKKLLDVLRWNEEAIGWTLKKIKGLHPSLCTHHIFQEDESRPVREAHKTNAHCFDESWSNGHDERERQRDPDMPSDEVESLHRLPEAELHDREGRLSSPIHRPNPGSTCSIELLLLPRWIFGLQLIFYLS